MRRPSRQGQLLVCAPCISLLLSFVPWRLGLRQAFTTTAASRSNFLIFLIFLALLTSCLKDEAGKPDFRISYVKEGAQTLLVDVKIKSFGSRALKEYGVVYGEGPSPDIAGHKIPYIGKRFTAFTCTLSNLKIDTEYYLRGYMQTDDGLVTYTPQVSASTHLHQLRYFYPRVATIHDEITIMGKNFEPHKTTVLLNGVSAEAEVYREEIKFFPPFGLQRDSVTIAIEIDGVRMSFPYKFRYIKGRWTRLKPYEDKPTHFFTKGLGLDGKVYATSEDDYLTDDVIREYDPLTGTWRDITIFPNRENSIYRWFALRRQLFTVGRNQAFWMYNLDAGTWHQLPPHPLKNLHWNSGNAFTFHGDGYLGLGGTDGAPNHTLWKFNALSFNWTRVSDFPGKGTETLSLVTDDAIYFVGGREILEEEYNYYKEVWKYNPINDTWLQLSDFPGNGSHRLNGISLNNKLYVGGGDNPNSTTKSFDDFWEYNPETDKWTRVVDLPFSRHSMYTCSFGDDSYLGAGAAAGTLNWWFNDVWKFEVE